MVEINILCSVFSANNTKSNKCVTIKTRGVVFLPFERKKSLQCTCVLILFQKQEKEAENVWCPSQELTFTKTLKTHMGRQREKERERVREKDTLTFVFEFVDDF